MNTWKISAVLVVLVCLLLASVSGAQQRPGGVIAIEGATIINGTGSPSIRNGTIVID